MVAMTIHVEDLRVDCKIGVWTHERNTTQQLRVDISVDFNGGLAADTDDLAHTLNYADIAKEVAFILEEGHFLLLEAASSIIVRWLMGSTSQAERKPIVQSANVRLTKFGALPGSTLACVQTGLDERPEDFIQVEVPWGDFSIIGQTERLELKIGQIAPGQSVPSGSVPFERGAILSLSDNLSINGARLARNERATWREPSTPHVTSTDHRSASFLLLLEGKRDEGLTS